MLVWDSDSNLVKQLILWLFVTTVTISGATILSACGTTTTKSEITTAMAYEGVSNYCHKAYDWTAAEDNPSIMGIEMGEDCDSAYHVVFRSYTGALVNFYVDKASGITRIVEYVPTLDIEEEAGTINLFDYLDKNE